MRFGMKRYIKLYFVYTPKSSLEYNMRFILSHFSEKCLKRRRNHNVPLITSLQSGLQRKLRPNYITKAFKKIKNDPFYQIEEQNSTEKKISIFSVFLSHSHWNRVNLLEGRMLSINKQMKKFPMFHIKTDQFIRCTNLTSSLLKIVSPHCHQWFCK